jgi:hypothetical protein
VVFYSNGAHRAITPIIRLLSLPQWRPMKSAALADSAKNYKENKKLPAVNRFFIE